MGIGGFLLQGGWGWNSRAIGPACMSIVGVDVVTAAGELIHADEEQNSDYWWAARGAGAGFFGVVTRFYLRCHPRPTATYTRTDVYSLDEIDTILHWALAFEPTLAPEFEFAILGTTPTLPDGRTVHDGTALMLMCQALMYDEDDALGALARLDECPVIDRALHREQARATSASWSLYDGPNSIEPEGVRWTADGMWTNAKADELVNPAKQLFRDVPTPESHIFWYPWRQQQFDNAAISVQGDLYLAAFAGWHDPSQDERYVAWPTDHMRRMEARCPRASSWPTRTCASARPALLSSENELRLERSACHQHDPGRAVPQLPDSRRGDAGERHSASRAGDNVVQVHEQLREAILSGDIRPGAKTSQAELARDLDVGRARRPLHGEAVRMLQNEGLISTQPNRRVEIASLSIEDAEELYVLRIALEVTAARITLPLLTETDFAELEGYMAQMEHLAGSASPALLLFRVPHRAFHERFVSRAGERSSRLIAELSDHAERYRRVYGGISANQYDQRSR